MVVTVSPLSFSGAFFYGGTGLTVTTITFGLVEPFAAGWGGGLRRAFSRGVKSSRRLP